MVKLVHSDCSESDLRNRPDVAAKRLSTFDPKRERVQAK
jgi:hypothetical protein